MIRFRDQIKTDKIDFMANKESNLILSRLLPPMKKTVGDLLGVPRDVYNIPILKESLNGMVTEVTPINATIVP